MSRYCIRDAARVDGAGPLREWRYVALPLSLRTCVRGVLAVTVLSLGELSASKMVSTPGMQSYSEVLFAQMPKVYAKVLPGMGAADAASVQFVIGPESQLAAYEQYLHATLGKDARLLRLYPRDFWVPAKDVR